MPSRKSNISTATNGGADEGSPAASRAPRESLGMSVEDLSLPRTMISRLSKGVLPPNTQIQKDALSALSKSATVFVNYLASNSMENATGAGKKTIQPQDVIVALRDTEFEFMIPRIEAELKKYNTVQCDKRNSYRRKVKEDKKAATTTTTSGTDATIGTTDATNTVGDEDDNISNAAKQSPSVATALGETTLNDDEEIEDEEEDEEVDDDEEGDNSVMSSTRNGKTNGSRNGKVAARSGRNTTGKGGSAEEEEPPSKKARRSPVPGDKEDGSGTSDVEDMDVEEDDEEGYVDDEVDDDEDDEEEGSQDENENDLRDDEERIQRQIERDEALDEAGDESE